MTHINIVSIGYGYWGKNVARNLFELGVLYGICEIHPVAQAVIKEYYPYIKLFTCIEDVWADPNVSAVAVSTPAETHAALVLEAFQHGKDAFVEKPLALTLADGISMVQAAHRNGRILMVGHLLEYHAAILKLEALIQTGELGKIQYAYSNRLNLGKFRREENILWSFAPHDIAVLLRLFGESPLEVMATGGAYLQPNIADTTVTNLLFDNGRRAHIFVSWLHPFKEQKLVIVGSKKMAIFDDREPQDRKIILWDKGANWVDNVPIPREGEGVAVAFEPSEPLKDELAHFVDCVQTRKTPKTDGNNGVRVLQVLQAAQQSLQTGGTRVPLFQSLSSIQNL